MKLYFRTVLLGLGLFFLLFGSYLVYERQVPITKVEASQSSDLETPLTSRLIIQGANIDLPIFEGFIKDQNWTTTKEGVSHLSSSVSVGEQGNSVIYGHNWSNLLGNLKQVKPGDEIIVINDRGEKFSYLVHFVTEATPDETHIYQNTTDYRLTIYTCTGFLDSKRLVVTAILGK